MLGPPPDDLGDPSLVIAGLSLWIYGRQFPESEDFWDANWLRVTAICEAPGAIIRVTGSLLMSSDIERFGNQCRQLLDGKTSEARLDPVEPELGVLVVSRDKLGHVIVQVQITPDNLSQHHHVEFEIDQSYLPAIIEQCGRIVEKYPIVGQR